MQAIRAGNNIVLTHYYYINDKKSSAIIWSRPFITMEDFVKKHFRVCFSSVCYRRPEHDVRFVAKGHEDFLFLYQLFEHYRQASIIPIPLVNYYEFSQSLSGNKRRSARWHLELLKIICKNKPFRLFYYFSWYMTNGILFKLRHR